MAFSSEVEMLWRICFELAEALVGQQSALREWKWGEGH